MPRLRGTRSDAYEQGDFPTLRAHDAGLYQSMNTVGADGLKSILAFIRADVPLDAFTKAA